jgi:hypothetical protein
LEASSESGGIFEVEKGLVDAEDKLKGLAVVVLDVEVENGFEEEELPAGFTPNKLSPIFAEVTIFICDCEDAGLDSASPVVFRRSLAEDSEIRAPRSTRTLPSLRLHDFRRQVSTYSRLSCPGKWPGKSPFNCNNKTIRSLHTLHFARVAEGGLVGSSHAYFSYFKSAMILTSIVKSFPKHFRIIGRFFNHTGRPPRWLIVSSEGSLAA